MRYKLFKEIADSALFGSFMKADPIPRQGRPTREDRMNTGTTILAFQYKDGILLGADRKTSFGYIRTKSLETIKIHRVSPLTCVAFAGVVSDAQCLLDLLIRVNKSFYSRYGQMLTVGGQVNFLSKHIRCYCAENEQFTAEVIIAGCTLAGEFEIYEIGLDGAKYKFDYVTLGSGGDDAESVLHESRKLIRDKTLTFEQALNLATRALYKSGVKDNCSGDLRMACPSIATITVDNGAQFIDNEVIRKERDAVVREEESKDV